MPAVFYANLSISHTLGSEKSPEMTYQRISDPTLSAPSGVDGTTEKSILGVDSGCCDESFW